MFEFINRLRKVATSDDLVTLRMHIANQLENHMAITAADINRVADQVEKIKGESASQTQSIADLRAALDAAGVTDPAVNTAWERLKSSIQTVDDMVADLPGSGPAVDPVTDTSTGEVGEAGTDIGTGDNPVPGQDEAVARKSATAQKPASK